MAENIARAGGEGVAALYQKTTGRWLVFYNGATSATGVDLETVLGSPTMAGRPVVLVSDWYNESDFPTNGFSEAAADTIYSALARLIRRWPGSTSTSVTTNCSTHRSTSSATAVARW